MSEPYLGQLMLVPYNFAPVGWLFCDGSLQPIALYDALYALLGTTFGGDGQATFGLPDLRGRTPIHAGAGLTPGQIGGSEQVTLLSSQLPAHSHTALATDTAATAQTPANAILAKGTQMYVTPAVSNPTVAMQAGAFTSSGGSQPHENRQPYIAMNWIICTAGIYPPQT